MINSNPSMHIRDRSAINAMTAEFVAKHGAPRRFPRGFSGEWFNMKSIMAGLGYEIAMKQNWYTVHPIGAKGRPERLCRTKALERIDAILAAHGREPFLRRG